VKLTLEFLAKSLRAARFFVIYFTSVARGERQVQEKIWAPKKSWKFFLVTKIGGENGGHPA
jgi:hypothetical protein